MKELQYMALAVPFFLFFIGLEYLVARLKKRKIFRFTSSITNMNVGIAERVTDMLTAGSFYFFYDYLHKNFAIFDIEPGIFVWIALIFATDFVWYWYHRFGHEINLFWGFHVVHHSSEEFNYTAGTRITILQSVVRTLFWSVLPIIGFPAPMITTMLLVHGLYPFFTHTQLIGKLGVLEYMLVTPSHHRVHHASNEQYLDKNFGDMFIIWDKLFGTFAAEEETCRYGLTTPLESHSFLWQHFHYLAELVIAMRATSGLGNKMKLLFGRPSGMDPDFREIAERRFLSRHRVKTHSTRFRRYVLVQFVLMILGLFFLLLFEHHLGTFPKTIAVLVIFVTLINCGAILEQRRWVFYLEFVRGTLIVLATFHYFPYPTVAVLLLSAIAATIMIFQPLQTRYLETVYGRET